MSIISGSPNEDVTSLRRNRDSDLVEDVDCRRVVRDLVTVSPLDQQVLQPLLSHHQQDQQQVLSAASTTAAAESNTASATIMTLSPNAWMRSKRKPKAEKNDASPEREVHVTVKG